MDREYLPEAASPRGDDFTAEQYEEMLDAIIQECDRRGHWGIVRYTVYWRDWEREVTVRLSGHAVYSQTVYGLGTVEPRHRMRRIFLDSYEIRESVYATDENPTPGFISGRPVDYRLDGRKISGYTDDVQV